MRLLLVPKIREAVDAWREQGYPGASDITRRLFEYWFEEDHEVAGFGVPFRYYFCQREAIETLVWLFEIVGEPSRCKAPDVFPVLLSYRHPELGVSDRFRRRDGSESGGLPFAWVVLSR